MLCERCKKKKAVMFYNENINGRIRSFNLCADCAAAMQQSGELEDMSAPFSNFSSPFVRAVDSTAFDDFFGLPVPDAYSPAAASSVCPLCKSSLADILKRRRVGCPTCYVTFSKELSRVITPLRVTVSHGGRVPRSHRQKQELIMRIQALKQQLGEAIQAERFEAAASLRDQIRNMENQL